MKQTAVEWLVEQITNKVGYYSEEVQQELFEQAKQMEKEQIMESFEAAEKYCGRDILHGDLYYNETFNSNKNATKTN